MDTIYQRHPVEGYTYFDINYRVFYRVSDVFFILLRFTDLKARPLISNGE